MTMNEINIRITELEATLLNCANDHTEDEIAEFEQELYELQQMQKQFEPKPYTLDFIPDKTQLLRYGTYVSARCECPNEYVASYMFNYACNEISITLMHHGMNCFSKMYYPATETPFRPLSLHEVERIATNQVIEYIFESGDDNMLDAVFSRLRPWNPDDTVCKLPKQKRYVFVDVARTMVLRVDGYHDGCGTGYLPEIRPQILDGKYKVTSTASLPHKKTVCEIVRVMRIQP